MEGKAEFMLTGFYIILNVGKPEPSEVNIELDGKEIPLTQVILNLATCPLTRIELYKTNVKWCIRYIWKVVKDFVK